MKTSFKLYLYIFSIVIPVVLLYNLIFILTAVYDGGIKEFDALNKTLPFISTKVKVSELFYRRFSVPLYSQFLLILQKLWVISVKHF